MLKTWVQSELNWPVDNTGDIEKAIHWTVEHPYGIVIVNGKSSDIRLSKWFRESKQRSNRTITIVLGIKQSEQWEQLIETSGAFSVVPNTSTHYSCLKSVLLRAQEHEQMLRTLMDNEKFVMLGQLLTGAAHELNNSLTGILGFTNMVLNEAEAESVRNDIFTIYHEAKRCQQIVQGLLTIGRDPHTEKLKVRLDQLVDSVLDVQQFNLSKNEITIIKNYGPQVPSAYVNYYQLQQVLINVIINAIHAIRSTGRPGELQVEIAETTDNVVIAFHDNGPGFPPDHAEKLFQPFYTTKSAGEGTGLGLAICRDIVNSHGGKIYATSRENEGAEFTIELPKISAATSEKVKVLSDELQIK
ncbi:HAMP domain-containing histidine kinase [candidate division KSB1 bacterium]|nr:HAMP domain-containing histidine kinase [candidate division KSB1 bacterium]